MQVSLQGVEVTVYSAFSSSKIRHSCSSTWLLTVQLTFPLLSTDHSSREGSRRETPSGMV